MMLNFINDYDFDIMLDWLWDGLQDKMNILSITFDYMIVSTQSKMNMLHIDEPNGERFAREEYGLIFDGSVMVFGERDGHYVII